MKPILLVLALGLLPRAARAENFRLDHRGAVGLSLAPGLEVESSTRNHLATQASSGLLELVPTVAINDEGDELVLRLRVLRGPEWGAAVALGYRKSFGREEWKTFAELGLKSDTAPFLCIGPRAGLGVMRELGPLLGLYAELGGSIEFSNGIRGAGELLIGVQGRSYLLE